MPVSQHHIPVNEDISQWPHLQEVDLPAVDADIELLIGNEVADAYSPLKVLTGPSGSPHAAETRLGWVVWDFVRDVVPQDESMCVNKAEVLAIEAVEMLHELDQILRASINRDFPENLIDYKEEWSQDDKRFIEKAQSSVKYSNGHYELGLPFKDEKVQLPDNVKLAEKRLKGLARKLKSNSKCCEDYKAFMSDIIKKGYAERVPVAEMKRSDFKVWYVPHHCVYHTKKPEKIGVVFYCSARFCGISLNDVLLQGPDMANNLLGVLLRFRQEAVALMADIEAMFFQVKVCQDDRNCLRFLWWTDGDLDKEPEVYRMVVHLFGAVSSPSCSNFALRKIVQDTEQEFDHEVVSTIGRNFYVDDCLKSVDTEDKAIDLVKGPCAACKRAGFHLAKWISNRRAVIDSIPKEEQAKEVKELDLEHDNLPVEQALGVYWLIETDSLGFKISLPDRPPNRRGILSVVSSIFDPLGLVSPFSLTARALFQDLCHRGAGWDDLIEGEDLQRWQQWPAGIKDLETVAVSRCFKPRMFGEVKSCQLHNFSDVSELGYGTVSSLRMINQQDEVHCALVIGKYRVAPLKKVSIPRMELTAATLAVRMSSMLVKELDYDTGDVLFWTDSMSVLRYIANETTRFHTFVVNRLAVIHDGSKKRQWKFVETKLNPADVASRGVKEGELSKSTAWFKGPEFLWKDESEWPANPESSEIGCIPECDLGVKRVNVCISLEPECPIEKLLLYFSSWKKLKQAVGWILAVKEELRRRAAAHISVKSTSEKPSVERIEECQQGTMNVVKESSRTSMKKLPVLTVDDFKKAEDAIFMYIQQ